MLHSSIRPGHNLPELPPWLAVVRKAVASLRFGFIQIRKQIPTPAESA